MNIGSAPVSWGIYEFEGIEPKFTYDQVLDEIAETGYTGLELGPYGYLPTDPGKLRDELQKRGLHLLSAFVPVKLVDAAAHESGAQEALKVGKLLAALGAKYVVLADDNGKVQELVQYAGRRGGSKLGGAEWDVFAAGVNKIAKRINNELGLEVVFHHHCAGYVETPEEVHELMVRTDPKTVGLCLDTGHWHYGGGDAVQAVQEYGKRIRHLHFKDCSGASAEQCRKEKKNYFEAIQAGVFCPLGEGEVNFQGVLEAMQASGYEGWGVVEQDILTDDPALPKQCSRANRDYLKKLGL